MDRPRARQAPSWLGTLIVTIAVAALCLRSGCALRRAVAPSEMPAPSAH